MNGLKLPAQVLAIDGALNNFGVATGYYTRDGIIPTAIHLLSSAGVKTNKIKHDAQRAKNIARFLLQFPCDLVVAEIAYGSKSYQAAWSLGVSLGLIASVNQGIIFVTPLEVKNVVRKGADKHAMIAWAQRTYPNLAWHLDPRNGKMLNENEHMADALAVMHAAYNKLKSGRYELVK